EIGGEASREIAVDLDGVEMPGALDQRPRERGETRTDFDDPVAGLRREGIHNARDVVRIGEEILAKALAGLVAVHRREPIAKLAARAGFVCRVLSRPLMYVHVLSRGSLRALIWQLRYSARSPHFAAGSSVARVRSRD